MKRLLSLIVIGMTFGLQSSAQTPIFDITVKANHKVTHLQVEEERTNLPALKDSGWICFFDSSEFKSDPKIASGSLDCTTIRGRKSVVVWNAISCPRVAAFAANFGVASNSQMIKSLFDLTDRGIVLSKNGVTSVSVEMKCHVPVSPKGSTQLNEFK